MKEKKKKKWADKTKVRNDMHGAMGMLLRSINQKLFGRSESKRLSTASTYESGRSLLFGTGEPLNIVGIVRGNRRSHSLHQP